MPANCIFCEIVRDARPAHIVLDDEACLAFLDHRPLFPGHTLVVPRTHFETLTDLPAAEVDPLFQRARLLARAVEVGLAAEGSFVALNNRISQSVPHLHVHVVPRRRQDGLRGFFWPRQKYESEEAARAVQARLKAAVDQLRAAPEAS